MSLNKEIKISSIEVAGEYKHLNIEKKVIIKENGSVISESNHRTSYSPDTDVSTLEQEIADVANVVWTRNVKDAYAAALALV